MLYSIAQEARGLPRVPTWPAIEHAIRRNFGGLDEINPVQIFRPHFGEMPNLSVSDGGKLSDIPVARLVVEASERPLRVGFPDNVIFN